MDIKAIADQVAAKFRTRDPFQIADNLGFIVVQAPLVEMRGLRQYAKKRVLLYINSALDERQQALVCAHEIGHHFMHRGMNRIFMDRNTCMVSNRYENEAHYFSVDLLFEDAELTEFMELPISDIAAYMGVPERLAEYRMNAISK